MFTVFFCVSLVFTDFHCFSLFSLLHCLLHCLHCPVLNCLVFRCCIRVLRQGACIVLSQVKKMVSAGRRVVQFVVSTFCLAPGYQRICVSSGLCIKQICTFLSGLSAKLSPVFL